ncbi:MAG: extracellular solute-binding protein [Clostridia bacterium]|nr:extracellular solute-binding protein [Clostridia bacterium]
MKKLSFILALMMAALCIFSAVPAMADEKTVITYWTNDRHDMEYLNKMIEKFNAENTDNIEIQMTVITDEYENQILLAYQGGTAPDIVGQSVNLKNFTDYGMLVSLSDYIAADEEYQKVNEPYTHAFEGLNAIGDDIYWVSIGMRSGVRIEYNKALLEKSGYTAIPATLDEYIEMAKTMTAAGNGEYYGIGFTSSSPFERQLEMMAQVSGIYYYDYVNGKFDFSGYKPILEKGRELVAAAYPDQQGVDNMRALFQTGNFALWGNASQEAGVFTQQLPITEFEWGVAPVPSLTGEIKGALQTTLSKGFLMMSSCENKDAAWKVIKFFQSEEFIKGYLENGYCLPITSYMDQRIDKTKIGRLADFSLLEYESVYPAVPTINLIGDDYRTTLWNAIMGYVEIDAAIEDLNTRYNQAYDEDILSGSVKRLVIADFDPLHPAAGTATYLDK